ncbi:MAG TPA: hypothetical protein VKM94_19870 [Blastocatellia bacterium]|nr:hypothetical protein [Blastocatellia bacterium]
MQFFQKLGALIEQRWRDKNYDEDAFPQIAADALAEADACASVDPVEILEWVHHTPSLPVQHDIESRFGNPPVTLYSGPRFYIDAYYWLDGTTAVHQHAFSGAFQVLAGSSIHSRYDFSLDERINVNMAVGKATLRSVELLSTGQVRRITPGAKFIHALFHLERPSVSLTVRTMHTPTGGPQFSYLKPFIAIDPFFKEQSAVRKVQTAVLLLKMKHPRADELIGELVESSDFHVAYLVMESAFHHLTGGELQKVFSLSSGSDRFQSLLERARLRHGELVDRLPPVFEELHRQSSLVSRRTYLTGSDERFFLALLLNVPETAKVLDLVRQRFGQQDPADTICDWVTELSKTRLLGSAEANVLGVEDFDEDSALALRGLLSGLNVEQIVSGLADKYNWESRAQLETDVRRMMQSFSSSVLLKSLLPQLGNLSL